LYPQSGRETVAARWLAQGQRGHPKSDECSGSGEPATRENRGAGPHAADNERNDEPEGKQARPAAEIQRGTPRAVRGDGRTARGNRALWFDLLPRGPEDTRDRCPHDVGRNTWPEQ